MRLHLHLSETRDEVENCLRETGMTPAMYLNSLGAFELPVTIAHGTHLTPEECELLAGKGIGVAVCTESNLKLSSGFAPIKAYRESGLRFAMATDGVASNNNLDLLAEAGFTARLHKALNNDPTFLPAPEVLRSVTIDAARVVGMGDKLGSLEAGKLADFILIDVNTLDSKPLYNVYSHLAYVLDSRHITDVFVGGEPVVLDRKLKRLDEAELIERADRYRAEIACGG
jgi:5-methylthioadenosine/S-adenosylhomocysteine deaminase